MPDDTRRDRRPGRASRASSSCASCTATTAASIRGKSTHVGVSSPAGSQSGIGLVKGMQSFTSIDTLAPDATYGPVGEIRLVPDPDTFVVLPYARAAARCSSTWSSSTTRRGPLDPRAFLQRDGRSRRAEAGLAFDAAFENEFYLARAGPTDGYRPVDRSLCFSAIGMESTEDVIQDIIAALTGPGADRRAVRTPSSAGASRSCRSATRRRCRAADNQVTYRQTVRGVAGAARADRVARPQALRRPGGQRRPPPLEHLGHRTTR